MNGRSRRVSREPAPARWRRLLLGGTVLKTTLFLLVWFAVSNLVVLNVGRNALIVALTAPVLNLGIPWWVVYSHVRGGQAVATVLLIGWFYLLSVLFVRIGRTVIDRLRARERNRKRPPERTRL